MLLKLFSRTDLAMPLLICHTPSEQNTIVKNTEKDDKSKCFFALKKIFLYSFAYNLLMWLKPVIFLLIILILLSLSSGLFFLFKDRGDGRGTMISLGIRVTLAALLLSLVAYGLYTGQILEYSLGKVTRVYIRIENNITQTTSTKCHYHDAAS